MAELPKYLTILSGDLPDFDFLVTQTRRLTEPRNYYQGFPREGVLLPSNILLFARKRAKDFDGARRGTFPPHHRFVLVIALTGRGTICVGPAAHPIEPGQACIIVPFQPHCFVDITPDVIDWLFITFELPRNEDLAERCRQGAWNLTTEESEMARQILLAWKRPDRRNELPLRLGLWLQALIRPLSPRSVRNQAPGRKPNEFVAAVNRLALARLSEPVSITDFARLLGMSPSSLRSRFRAATGRTLAAHAREIKLHHACELLHQTDLRISEIATQCGYDSLFAFSRAFRNLYGIAPRAYRAKLSG